VTLTESSGAPGERLTIARTVEAVEALRDVLESAPVDRIDADVDYFLAVVGHRDEVVRPHVVVLSRPGRPDAIAVARLEELPLEARFGYRVVARPRVRCLHVVAGGLIGVDDDETAERLLRVLDAALRDGEADVLHLSSVPLGGLVEATAGRVVPRWRRDPVPEETARWTADIPDSLDGFLAARSKNTRENVRRYGRRFLRDFEEDRLSVRVFGDDAGELDALCADLEAVAALTYQRGLGVGFADDKLQRALMRLGMQRGTYRAWVLYIDGRPVAFWDGQSYRGTFGIGSPGFDPAFSEQRIGTWLQMRMIEDLCADPDITTLDYGAGDAQYKRSFADHRIEQTDTLLFAPRPRAMRANAVRGGVAAASRVGKRVLGDSDMGQRLKRAWRRRAAA